MQEFESYKKILNESRITIFDEFSRAEIRIRDMFLCELEKKSWKSNGRLMMFTVPTGAYDKIDDAFKQRVTVVKTKPPTRTEIVTWLASICKAENIQVGSNSGLEAIADIAGNVPRECLGHLHTLSIYQKPLTESFVLEVLQQ